MKISAQGQIRIPRQFMEALGIDVGDYVEAVLEEGQIGLRPRKLIDPHQGWYWTPQWQAEERAADQDVERGEVSPEFKDGKEALKWLKQ